MELDNMVKLSDKCNIQVPMEVLNLIDNGKNPNEFMRDVINSCISKNQVTKGKTDAFKGLWKHLLEELKQTFPIEIESYREIRASSVACQIEIHYLDATKGVGRIELACIFWIIDYRDSVEFLPGLGNVHIMFPCHHSSTEYGSADTKDLLQSLLPTIYGLNHEILSKLECSLRYPKSAMEGATKWDRRCSKTSLEASR